MCRFLVGIGLIAILILTGATLGNAASPPRQKPATELLEELVLALKENTAQLTKATDELVASRIELTGIRTALDETKTKLATEIADTRGVLAKLGEDRKLGRAARGCFHDGKHCPRAALAFCLAQNCPLLRAVVHAV